jgi:hypothetical protein
VTSNVVGTKWLPEALPSAAKKYCGRPLAGSRNGAAIWRTATGASVAVIAVRIAQSLAPPCTSIHASTPSADIGNTLTVVKTSTAFDNCTGTWDWPPRRSIEYSLPSLSKNTLAWPSVVTLRVAAS